MLAALHLCIATERKMPDHFCLWFGAGVLTLVVLLSNLVAVELRGEHRRRADGLIPADFAD
jgi:hypothetical protein